MAIPILKSPGQSGVISRALRIGLEQGRNEGQDGVTSVKLTPTQQKMVMNIANVLGLSVQSVLNAGILFALHYAKRQKLRPEDLKQYPKRLAGRGVPLEMTLETSAQVKEANAQEAVGGCAVAGIKLLHSRLFE